MMTDLLHASPDFPAKDQFFKLADSISHSVKRCSTITNRLLGFARHIDVQNEPIDCKALIEEVLSFTGKEAEYRSIQVDVQMDQDVPTIQSDRNQLQQVFLNILNNAFAAVSDGGHIGVNIARDGPGMVSISIEDNGIGIRKEDLSRIFEPFFTTKGRGGTGLGLSITYGIVKELGGEIKVASEVNKGTTFTVTLPINRT
jgi:signal transduction histidine kinase